MADSTTHLVEYFEEAEEASQSSRDEAERAWDYYDGNQLTSAELAALAKRNQPPVIENLVRPKIDGLCGLERQTRTDPMAYPRTLKDSESAQVATDALRYVADDQRFDIKRSHAFKDTLLKGFGGVEIGAEQVRGAIDPVITQLPWDRLFFDPHSALDDFSDASYIGFVTWMDRSKAKGRWRDAANEIEAAFSNGEGAHGDTFDDKPKQISWFNKSRDRVRVITIYHLEEGVWQRSVFTKNVMLEETAPSPYLDTDGEPECAIILMSAFIDRENDRYGLVRDLYTLQDEVNKRRSKYLHLVNSRQIRVDPNHARDKELIRKEAARPDAVFVAENGEFEILNNGDMAAGQFTLLAQAQDAVKGMGPNAHMQGKEGSSQSGRAILAMQQAGMTEMAPLLDGLRDFNIRCYRSIWARVRQFWNAERWVRITDDDKAARFVGVNTTKGAVAVQKIKKAFDDGQIDEPTARQYVEQITQDPTMREPANVLAELDVDIQIEEVQSTPTLQAEEYEKLINAVSSGMVQLPPEVLIRAGSFRDKQKLLDLVEEQKKQQQQAQEQQGQMAAQAQEVAMKTAMADLELKQAQALLAQAKAESEQASVVIDQQKLQLDAYEAGARV